jgi:hypothetical protein
VSGDTLKPRYIVASLAALLDHVTLKEVKPPLAVVSCRMADDPRPQLDKFKDLARELECDDDEAAFDERLRKLATTPKPVKPEGNEQ